MWGSCKEIIFEYHDEIINLIVKSGDERAWYAFINYLALFHDQELTKEIVEKIDFKNKNGIISKIIKYRPHGLLNKMNIN
jgi:hypothetical protein